MLSEALQRELAQLAGDADRPHCLPAACYRDPEVFALEREKVLRPGWHAVARWDALPEPGDYASLELAGEPLLLVRDDDGALRVLSRVCRHRAHTVVEGSGNTQRFVCPYHRWSYARDGRLETAPLGESARGLDPSRCGLPELRSEWWMGFLMVSADSAAAPLAPRLGALAERLAPSGLETMRTVGCLDFDSAWNWKVMVDNFMESYHHIGPHAKSLQKSNRAQDTFVADLEGPFSLLENPGHSGAPTLLVAQVFPTLLLAGWEGLPVAVWYEMQIESHEHFRLRIHLLATPELADDAEVVAELREQTRAVHLEDIPVCEGVQRGIASRLWEPGPLTQYEAGLARFHRYLVERLRS